MQQLTLLELQKQVKPQLQAEENKKKQKQREDNENNEEQQQHEHAAIVTTGDSTLPPPMFLSQFMLRTPTLPVHHHLPIGTVRATPSSHSVHRSVSAPSVPINMLSPMHVMELAGLIRINENQQNHLPSVSVPTSVLHARSECSRVLLLPACTRIMDKSRELLANELQHTFHPLPMQIETISQQSASSSSSSSSSDPSVAPYDGALDQSLTLMNEIALDEFVSSDDSSLSSSSSSFSLPSLSITTETHHPALSSHSPSTSLSSLWRASKSTHEIALFDVDYNDAMQRYSELQDSLLRFISLSGALPDRSSFLVSSSPRPHVGISRVDADQAHELHVISETGPNMLLQCDNCNYVAKTTRATAKTMKMANMQENNSRNNSSAR